jgi:hypothetical protein
MEAHTQHKTASEVCSVHVCRMKRGLGRSPEFQRKGLGTHTGNVGLRCDVDCIYCSTPSLDRTHPVFKAIGQSAFTRGLVVIYAEPLNPRGPGIKRCEEALLATGFSREAEAFHSIRCRAGWNEYAARLTRLVQATARKFGAAARLRMLLYTRQFDPRTVDVLRRDGEGLVWL